MVLHHCWDNLKLSRHLERARAQALHVLGSWDAVNQAPTAAGRPLKECPFKSSQLCFHIIQSGPELC